MPRVKKIVLSDLVNELTKFANMDLTLLKFTLYMHLCTYTNVSFINRVDTELKVNLPP